MSDQKIIVPLDKDLEEIIPMFLENRAKDLIGLDKAVTDNNFDPIKVIGHKLAGNAGSYGLPDLGHIGAQIEEAGNNEDMKKVIQLIDKYKYYMNHLEIKFE